MWAMSISHSSGNRLGGRREKVALHRSVSVRLLEHFALSCSNQNGHACVIAEAKCVVLDDMNYNSYGRNKPRRAAALQMGIVSSQTGR